MQVVALVGVSTQKNAVSLEVNILPDGRFVGMYFNTCASVCLGIAVFIVQ
jgi:hypothetical protein